MCKRERTEGNAGAQTNTGMSASATTDPSLGLQKPNKMSDKFAEPFVTTRQTLPTAVILVRTAGHVQHTRQESNAE